MKNLKKLVMVGTLCVLAVFMAACPESVDVNVNTPNPGTSSILLDFTTAPVLTLTWEEAGVRYSFSRSDPRSDFYEMYWKEGDEQLGNNLTRTGNKIDKPAISGQITNMAGTETVISVVVVATKSGYNKTYSSVARAYKEGKTISIAGMTGGTVESSYSSALSGMTVTLTVKPSDTYTYTASSLKVNDGAVPITGAYPEFTFTMPASNVTVTCGFTQNQQNPQQPDNTFTVTNAAMNGGTVTGVGAFEASSPVTLTVTPYDGFEYAPDSLKVNNGAISITGTYPQFTFTMPAAPVEVSCGFTASQVPPQPIPHAINFAAMTGGSVTSDTASPVLPSANVILTVHPAANYTYTVGSLKVNDGSVTLTALNDASWTFRMPPADVTVTCSFTENQITPPKTQYQIIVYGPFAYGTVISNKTEAEQNETVTLTITPTGSATLNTITVTGSGGQVQLNGNGNTRTFNMPASNVTVTAVFDPHNEPVQPYVPEDSIFDVKDGSIKVDFDDVQGANYYQILRSGSRLGTYTEIIGRQNTSDFTDPSPNPNKYENYYRIVAKNTAGVTISTKEVSLELEMFGKNMLFYDIKYDNKDKIRAEINDIHEGRNGWTKTFGAEFSQERYGMFLKPGTYDLSQIDIGFYTHIGGLGRMPSETRLTNTWIDTKPHLGAANATCTFWRSIENFEISGGACGFHWGVSQAAPARRMKVVGQSIFDYGGWASGGFTADCYFQGEAGSWSQQQWYARNCYFSQEMYGVNWNRVVQGSTGVVRDSYILGNGGADGAKTNIPTTPVIREKPFLYLDRVAGNGEYKVFVPAIRREAKGPTWTDTDMGLGRSISIGEFYIVKPGLADPAAKINSALANGKHIFITPGRYELAQPIHITRAGTILLGTGYATLIPGPTNPKGAVFIDDVDGVTVAGILFDALYSSTYLIAAGPKGATADHSANPTLLADLVLRVGGYRAENVNVEVAGMVNSHDVIGDQFWVWRADHGQGVGWNRNTSKNGMLVTGDRVIFYGLFVEHFQEYQTLWLGEKGRMYFYQNETPYDPTGQNVFRSHNGTVDGWASYKVGNNVNEHLAVGLGIYAVFINVGGATVFLENAIEVPNKPDVTIERACTVEISSGGARTGIRHIVNGTGPAVTNGYSLERLVRYNNGTANTNGNKNGAQPGDEVHNVPSPTY